tara:strand:+ start:525 stop:761 length:237 start_codon:yes stop_codon:yes gene_type:complete
MFGLGKLIDWKWFFISLSLGLFVTYIVDVGSKTIYVYPNPETQDKILYKDKVGTCFKFNSKKVKCPKDEKKIRSYEVQ